MALADFAHLVTDRHLVTTPDQLAHIIFQCMQRYACQGSPLILTIGATRQHNLQLTRGNISIFIEGFIEIPDLVKKDGVRVLALYLQILLTGGRRHLTCGAKIS